MTRFKQRRPKSDAAEENGSSSAAVTQVLELVEEDGQGLSEDLPAVEAAPEPVRPTVGEHVETVLKAAEDAAERLVAEATARASEIRDEAEAAHAEALSDAERVRVAAEDDAVARRAAAEEEAASLRADAERDAATFAERTSARYEDLLSDTALAEDRLRRLVGGLRDVADRLDGLLGPARDEAPGEPIRDELHEEEDGSLEEALDPSHARTDSRNE